MSKGNFGKGKKEYAPSVGFWPTKTGKGFRVFLDQKTIETLAKAEEGGSLFLQEVPEEYRKDNTPHYRVTIFAPGEKQDHIEKL